jgi:uncharacterized protein involved in exopolysaccharide biosynthesis
MLPHQQRLPDGLFGQVASLAGLSLEGQDTWESLYGRILESDRVLDAVLARRWSSADRRTLSEVLQPDAAAEDAAEKRARDHALKKRLRTRIITFSRDRNSGFMELEVHLEHRPALAAEIANALADELAAFLQRSESSRASQQRIFVAQRLEEVQKQAAAAASRLAEFLAANRLYAASPELSRRHAELQREVDVQNAIWIELSRQLEIAKIEEKRQNDDLEILDAATPPVVRSAPRRALLVALGLAIGALLASLFVVLAEIRRPRPGWKRP